MEETNEARKQLLWSNFPHLYKIFDRPFHEANDTKVQAQKQATEWQQALESLDAMIYAEDDNTVVPDDQIDVGDLAILSVEGSVEKYITQGTTQLVKTDRTVEKGGDKLDLIQEIVEDLHIKSEEQLSKELNGEPRNETEAQYLPLETVKLTNQSEKKHQRLMHYKSVLHETQLQNNGEEDALMVSSEGQRQVRTSVSIIAFSQLSNKQVAHFSLMADKCAVSAVYDAIVSTCQGLREVSSPGFVYVEGVFFCIDDNQALVPEDQLQNSQSAWRVSLAELEFKVGYPYLVRHSTSQPGAIHQQCNPLIDSCCDHFFIFKDILVVQPGRDQALLASETGAVPTYQRLFKRQICEFCQVTSAFAAIVYQHSQVSSQGVTPQKNTHIRISKSVTKQVNLAQFICSECYQLLVRDQQVQHTAYPYSEDCL